MTAGGAHAEPLTDGRDDRRAVHARGGELALVVDHGRRRALVPRACGARRCRRRGPGSSPTSSSTPTWPAASPTATCRPSAGATSLGWGVVYPLLVAPAWLLRENGLDAYRAALVVNALAMSLAAVPAFLFARMVVVQRAALLVAAGAVLVPTMALTGSVMTENAAYPLFLIGALAHGAGGQVAEPGGPGRGARWSRGARPDPRPGSRARTSVRRRRSDVRAPARDRIETGVPPAVRSDGRRARARLPRGRRHVGRGVGAGGVGGTLGCSRRRRALGDPAPARPAGRRAARDGGGGAVRRDRRDGRGRPVAAGARALPALRLDRVADARRDTRHSSRSSPPRSPSTAPRESTSATSSTSCRCCSRVSPPGTRRGPDAAGRRWSILAAAVVVVGAPALRRPRRGRDLLCAVARAVGRARSAGCPRSGPRRSGTAFARPPLAPARQPRRARRGSLDGIVAGARGDRRRRRLAAARRHRDRGTRGWRADLDRRRDAAGRVGRGALGPALAGLVHRIADYYPLLVAAVLNRSVGRFFRLGDDTFYEPWVPTTHVTRGRTGPSSARRERRSGRGSCSSRARWTWRAVWLRAVRTAVSRSFAPTASRCVSARATASRGGSEPPRAQRSPRRREHHRRLPRRAVPGARAEPEEGRQEPRGREARAVDGNRREQEQEGVQPHDRRRDHRQEHGERERASVVAAPSRDDAPCETPSTSAYQASRPTSGAWRSSKSARTV